MPLANANGIQIEYDTFGDRSSPALLLVMGLGGQLIVWDPGFCQLLADRGFFVIRYDNRDVGLSTKIEGPLPDLLAVMGGDRSNVPYYLEDMADDAAGLLDTLGIPKAHVVGVSMGGMIAQAVTIRHAAKVASLCSIMSTTGDPAVGQPTQEVLEGLLSEPPATREEAIDSAVPMAKIIGSPGFPFDEARIRSLATAAYDRANYPQGGLRQLVAILASPDRTEGLGAVAVPTVVIHGDADPLGVTRRPAGARRRPRPCRVPS
jgi:pimeloyl-ACP methyl ester carboxylesterase